MEIEEKLFPNEINSFNGAAGKANEIISERAAPINSWTFIDVTFKTGFWLNGTATDRGHL